MREVVLEKAASGYRWKVVQAPVPAAGDSEVLVRVHAVSLNRGDLTRLESDSESDRTGQVPVTDAAGEVVAVGSRVKGVHKGERVTNTYFKNWVDGPFSHEWRVFPLDAYEDALKLMATGQFTGKIVLTLN